MRCSLVIILLDKQKKAYLRSRLGPIKIGNPSADTPSVISIPSDAADIKLSHKCVVAIL